MSAVCSRTLHSNLPRSVRAVPRFAPALLVITTLLILPATPASASGLCAEISALIDRARATVLLSSGGGASLQSPSGAERCRTTRTIDGQRAYHCAWAFPYRDAAAQERFDELNEALQACFSATTAQADDQEVNHPDSFDQRQYRIDDVAVSVSLKDKGALQQTYVFVGVTTVE